MFIIWGQGGLVLGGEDYIHTHIFMSVLQKPTNTRIQANIDIYVYKHIYIYTYRYPDVETHRQIPMSVYVHRHK